MKKDLHCTVFDESEEYSLGELCSLCRVHAQFIHELIDEGILSPQGSKPQEWRFPALAVKRVQISIRLQQDLRVNLPGTALALDLLEEIEILQRTKCQLERFSNL